MGIPGFLRRIPLLERFLPETSLEEKLSAACRILGKGYSWETVSGDLSFSTRILLDGNVEFSGFSTRRRWSMEYVLRKAVVEIGPERCLKGGILRRFSPGKGLLGKARLLGRVLGAIGETRERIFFGKVSGGIFVWICAGRETRIFDGWEDEDMIEAEIGMALRNIVGGNGNEEVELWLEARGR